MKPNIEIWLGSSANIVGISVKAKWILYPTMALAWPNSMIFWLIAVYVAETRQTVLLGTAITIFVLMAHVVRSQKTFGLTATGVR